MLSHVPGPGRGANVLHCAGAGAAKGWGPMAISQDAAQHMFTKLGFRSEAVLSDFVKNESGLTEDLVIMSHNSGEHWSF